jgi:hypothetical protein
MKLYIILLVLWGCGKHQQPPGSDLNLPVAKEELVENTVTKVSEEFPTRFVAETQMKEQVTFHMKLKGSVGPSMKYETHTNLNDYAQKSLLSSETLIPNEDYFHEWMRPKFAGGVVIVVGEPEKVGLDLNFNELKDPPDLLKIIKGKETIYSWKWKKELDIELTKKELSLLRNGEYSFQIERSDKNQIKFSKYPLDVIKKNTYRVYVSDEKKGNVYYLSHDYPLIDFLKTLNIQNTHELALEQLLSFIVDNNEIKWWIRKVNKSDYVIYKASLKSLSDTYKHYLRHQTTNLKRLNGKSTDNFNLVIPANAALLLQIRGERTYRTFQSHVEKTLKHNISIPGFPGPRYPSYIYTEKVSISNQITTGIDVYEVLDQLLVNRKKLSENEFIKGSIQYGTDTKGYFIQLILKNTGGVFGLSIKNLPRETFVKIGDVRRRVDDLPWENLQSQEINEEAELKLSIAAYVENR